MNSPAPDAEDVSIVLVGSFNPGIFHPEWFGRQGILMPQEVEDAKVKVVSPQVTQVLFLDMKLDVFPNRFALETKDASRAEKLQDVVTNILHYLPHTPVTACGLNNTLQFDIADESYWHKIGHALAPKEPVWNEVLEKPGMQNLVIRGLRSGDFPGQVNVSVAPVSNLRMRYGLSVSSNCHYDVPRNDGGTAQSELVPEFVAAEWKSALDQARRVAYRIFATIEKDASDAI